MSSEENEKLIMCVFCKKEVKEHKLTSHLEKHEMTENKYPVYLRNGKTSDKYDCQICGKLFLSLSQIQYHLYSEHQTLYNQRCPQCPKCKKILSTYFKLSYHINICKGVKNCGTTCPNCDKTLCTNYVMRKHLEKCVKKSKA